jgi:hypothetical protein
MSKKIIKQTNTEYVDQFGEVRQKQSTQTFSFSAEDDYIKVYIKHINHLSNLPAGLEGVIYELIKNVNYGNKIVINSHVKRDISVNTGKSFNTVNQYMSKLVECQILIREARGVYYLNPMFYGKGKWKDIVLLRDKLQVNIEYDSQKYTVTNSNLEN